MERDGVNGFNTKKRSERRRTRGCHAANGLRAGRGRRGDGSSTGSQALLHSVSACDSVLRAVPAARRAAASRSVCSWLPEPLRASPFASFLRVEPVPSVFSDGSKLRTTPATEPANVASSTPNVPADDYPQRVRAEDVGGMGEVAEEAPAGVGHQAGADAVERAGETRAQGERARGEPAGDGERRQGADDGARSGRRPRRRPQSPARSLSGSSSTS